MVIDAARVQALRAMTGAGIVDCKNALTETEGDIEKAAEILRKKGIAKAGNKGERVTKEGLIDSYIHGAGKVGVLVEVQCETDFVARTEQFKEFVHEIAMQIAATSPLYVSSEQIPMEVIAKEKEMYHEEFAGSSKPQEIVEKIILGKLEKYYSEVCLLNQAYIKDEDMTIADLLKTTIAKTGENIQVKRFARFVMGE